MTALWLCRFAQTTAAVLLAGTAAVRLLARGTDPGPMRRGWRRLAWASGSALLVVSVLQLGLTAAAMSGQPLTQALTGDAIGDVLWGTRFGTVWRVRMGLLAGWFAVAAVTAAFRRPARRTPAALDIGDAVLAAALLGNLVWVGHADASAKSAWLLPVDTAHALAAGAWPGGLFPLALLLARARGDTSLLPAAATIIRRFSNLSVAAVGVLAFSGVLNGVGLVGTFTALGTSEYGWLVLVKAALFTSMVGLGALNRRLSGRTASGGAAPTVHRLWRNVAWECALAAGVLLATEALAMNAPPVSSG